MKLSSKFYASTASLWIGWIVLLVGFGNLSNSLFTETSYAFTAGIGIVCGATAYRVLKRRILKIGEYDTWELLKEYTSLVIIGFILLRGIMISVQIYPQALQNPLTFLFIPIWSFIAYFLIRFKGNA